MPASPAGLPELMPLLSRGKHRNPRKGACFMELASYLAGERWSDHPSCTHPLLAELARLVNDLTSNAGRPRLAPLIPAVIGVRSDDLRMDAQIALRCAQAALPVAAEERQRVLAVSVLTGERVLAELDGRAQDDLSARSQAALAAVPLAAERSRRLVGDVGVSIRGYRRHAAPATVRCAVRGIAEACIDDPDALMHAVLSGVVADCRRWQAAGPQPRIDADRWTTACQLTGGN
ncbi:MAG: hypothetical protein H0U47_11350 [Nocardioidaceae bacterium]|nr:hypothetical protein [Nocardioidaceae bacterium]